MSLLAPWFLFGALLIGGPLLAHLVRRATRERVAFSATRWLDATAPRLSRRSRVQDPWLLLLRLLIVLLLVFGFARPFFPADSATDGTAAATAPRHVVAVLDESASLRRGSLWAEARDQVETLAARLGPADRFVLLAASSAVSPLITAERWLATPPPDRPALVASVLDGREPTWGPTHLDTALEAALDELAALGKEAGGTGEVVLISDLRAGSRVAGIAGRPWPAGSRLSLIEVGRDAPANANVGLAWLGWITTPEGERAARVRLTRHGAQATPALALTWRDGASGRSLGEATPLSLAPGEARVVGLALPAGASDTPLRLELTGDAEPFDNTLWVVPPRTRAITLHYVGEHGENDPAHARFYLTRATEGWREPVITVAPWLPTSAPAESGKLEAWVVARALTTAEAETLRARLAAGAFVLVLAGDAGRVAGAAALAGETGWSAGTVARGDALLGTLDWSHPLFAPFADPRFSDFSRVRFWAPVPILTPAGSAATVVARFDDDSPAVLEVAAGAGRLVVWGGDWTAAAGQWVLSTKFVPWLQAWVERAAGGATAPAMSEVGAAARLTASSGARWAPWPSGIEGEATSTLPAAPGVYSLFGDGPARLVALHTPAAESVTVPLGLETWEQLGAPINAAVPALANVAAPGAGGLPPGGDSPAAVERAQQGWRWVLLAALGLLALESIVAALRARATPAPAPLAPATS